MITDALIDALIIMLDTIFSLMPSNIVFEVIPTAPNEIPAFGNIGTPDRTVIGYLVAYSSKYNTFFPVAESYVLLAWTMGFQLWARAWKFIRFLVSVIRGAGVMNG